MRKDALKIGIIGGTAMESWSALAGQKPLEVDTPFGSPSSAISCTTFKNTEIVFLNRHGVDHTIPPHLINYRANIWALNEIGGIDSFRADVTEPDDWEKLYSFVDEKYGRLDILVNNAGSGVAVKEITEQSVVDIDYIVKLNLNFALR